MQRTKKPLIWLMMVALVVSLIPAGLAPVASAAGQTSYFTPDNEKLKRTAGLSMDAPDPNNSVPSDADKLSRNSAYIVTSSEQVVAGTFTNVTGSTLGVNVQLMNLQNGKWVPESTRVAPGVVTVDPDRPDNRFRSTLTLFPGMNRVTFTGSQGPSERSESFYILYDSVPYIDKLQVLGGSDNLNLNEGAQVVVNTGDVTITGVAQNSKRVTVSLNNGTALPTGLQLDGNFFSPVLNLKPGHNDLAITIEGGTDKKVFNYSLLYYNDQSPFSTLDLREGGAGLPQSMLSNVRPTYGGELIDAYVNVQLILPEQAGNPTPVIGLEDETLEPGAIKNMDIEDIPSVGQNTPGYTIITFDINPIPFKDTNGMIDRLQNHILTVDYGDESVRTTMNLEYVENAVSISNLKYIRDFNQTNMIDATTVPEGVNLDGASVNSSDFYILVETNRDPGSAGLNASYLPRGTSDITIDFIGNAVKDDPTKRIYHITGFKSGNQMVRFAFDNSSTGRNVTISYASKSFISVDNLTDGQTYDMNSIASDGITLEGRYVDFDNLTSPFFVGEIFANGRKVYSTSDTPAPGQEYPLSLSFGTDGSFSKKIKVDGDTGPLYIGENRIVLTGTAKDTKGQISEVSKELRIFINDNNISTINNFQPSLSNNTSRFPTDTYSSNDPWVRELFNLSPEFVFNDNKYTTSLKSFDLVLRGAGATRMSLNMGTQNIFELNIPDGASDTWVNPIMNDQFATNNPTVIVEKAGRQQDFVVRLKNLKAETPGTYIYTLDLYNKTGAKTSQKVEIVKEVTGYRILSPVANSGTQIVVNKNFVHFDIEAEGATGVIIDKQPAAKLQGAATDRFVLDYVGLKPDKSNAIKITINRDGVTTNDTVNVFYTNAAGVDSQYMAPKVANKYSAFNKQVELSFPKGTIMESTDTRGIKKFYPENKLLFGIADPATGIVERRNDYGSLVGIQQNANDPNVITVPDEYYRRFSAVVGDAINFSPISDIYWVSGGMGESGRDTSNYKAPTNGSGPYTVNSLYGDPQIPAERKIKPSQRGSLTIAYDPNVVDDAGSTISVFYYTPNREWRRIGGEVDSKKHTVTVPFDDFGYYKVMKLRRSYNDITNHGWARNILNALYAKGFMTPIRFEQFGTDDRTSRGEFATLLVKGLNLPITSDSNRTFTDVAAGTSSFTWDYDSIETAARAGIVTGLSDGVFGPDQPLTREQAAVMIARALELKLASNDSKLTGALAKSFIDSGSMEAYSRPAIQAVTKAKIMEGSPVTVAGQKKPQFAFNPKGNLTRAEAGKIAVELLKKSTKVFPKTLS
ncbi:S-layer homology domain-containing protein [Paenibacillus polymyxa]|uniref:S-layer homology domain-containing protein n=1 Tax=Paenibacillus polymyxa TaxID=1406 RepID=UPI001BEA1F4B|nr:S-layer homology domain-containing protein [Paenibacillus polymyxa]MBT2285182.1 S-layer homology domain-containing protein [Paenibacillus polymyxa]